MDLKIKKTDIQFSEVIDEEGRTNSVLFYFLPYGAKEGDTVTIQQIKELKAVLIFVDPKKI